MILAWIGLLLGLGAIIFGAFFEGLELISLVQPTAALIVFGGTLGASMLSSPLAEFAEALRMAPRAFFRGEKEHSVLIGQLINLANVARREGIIALDSHLNDVNHPFARQFLRQVIDGYDPAVLDKMIDDAIDRYATYKTAAAKVWETAGGYSPTIGIIGAVLGLIHVMGNISDSNKLGDGIAVAFVATVYGVGTANLILIPLGNRLKKLVMGEVEELEIIGIALGGIQKGLNPRVIEDQIYNSLGLSRPEGMGSQADLKAAA